ncbi:MAG: hypothetical protein RI946_137, partial [Pseudomonadota bacterium]
FNAPIIKKVYTLVASYPRDKFFIEVRSLIELMGYNSYRTTDNGMTISAATDMGAGSIPDIADKELDAQTDDLTAPEVKIGYNGVTIELQSEGVDDYYDGDLENYDIGVSGAFGGLSYGIALETERNTASDYSATIGYTVAGVSLTINQNDVDGAKVSVLYQRLTQWAQLKRH